MYKDTQNIGRASAKADENINKKSTPLALDAEVLGRVVINAHDFVPCLKGGGYGDAYH